MKKVLLVGNYGVGNIGDDLLMSSCVSQLKQLGAQYSISCPGDVTGSVSIPPAGIRSFFSFKWLDFYKELRKCDVVVFGGGGLLNPEEKMSLLIWGQIITMAKLYKKEVVMIGQSFSKVDGSVKFLLDMVDKISVRDSFSVRILKDYFEGKVVKVHDLAWKNDMQFIGTIKNKIAINVRPYKYVNDSDVKTVINELICSLEDCMSFDEIVLLGFGLEDVDYADVLLSIGLKQKYKLTYACDYDAVVKAIAESKIVIAERLHACISTMKLDRPIVSLSYSSKVFSMMNDYSVKSLVNLRKDINNINYSDLIRDALAMNYKKPHPELDKVLVDVLLEN